MLINDFIDFLKWDMLMDLLTVVIVGSSVVVIDFKSSGHHHLNLVLILVRPIQPALARSRQYLSVVHQSHVVSLLVQGVYVAIWNLK